MNKIITITNTRPDLLRQSLIIKQLDNLIGKNHIHIYTGQNYDNNLYQIFLKDLNLRKPNYEFNLTEKLFGVEFLGRCAINIEKILNNFNPNHTLINILGDVNGSFISTYIASQMGFKVIHNESGNRSGRNIIEEINRKSIDSMSHKLLCYTQRSRENLLREGYNPNKIIVCGNPLIEVLKEYFNKNILKTIHGKYIVVTLHRHETINSFERLIKITNALKILAEEYKIIFCLHPSLKDKMSKNKNIENLFIHKNIELVDSLNYTTFLNLMYYSSIILSDSGGECEEAAILKIPCLVLREETERTELLEQSQMILCGIETEDIIRNSKIIRQIPISGIPEEYNKPTSSIVVKILLGV
ncbi:MAG: UDP-N-acetylglucosamine 2-epimerase [Patescibacteria group bacterium]